MHELKKRGFFYATLAFFSLSLSIHYYTSFVSYSDLQEHENQKLNYWHFFNEFLRQVMENWQSEFLQLMWQVGGLSFLLWIGSHQSKHIDQRLEKQIEYLIHKVSKDSFEADNFIKEMKEKFPDK